MRFTTVRFSTSVKVFGAENAVGMLATFDNQTSLKCDSIESAEGLLLITRNGETKAVPLSKLESGDPVLEEPKRKAS